MKLVVQMGHVARTSGATGTNGEQDFARAAAARVKHHVERMGHEVKIIYADVPGGDYAGDAFVAIHCDGSTSPSARGASIGYRTVEGQRLGHAWMKSYQAVGWTGGFRPDNYTAALAGFYGTRNAVAQGNRAAFIAECGFLTNPEDRKLLDSPDGHDRFGKAIAAALLAIGWSSTGPTPQPQPTPPNDEDDEMREAIIWLKDPANATAYHPHYVVGNVAKKIDAPGLALVRWLYAVAHPGQKIPDVGESEKGYGEDWRQTLAVVDGPCRNVGVKFTP